MNLSQKIKLENTIFARAESLGVQVCACGGRLRACSEDAYLKALLEVYNSFFGRENQENFCAWENGLEGLSGFTTRIARTPVLATKEYEFELIVGG